MIPEPNTRIKCACGCGRSLWKWRQQPSSGRWLERRYIYEHRNRGRSGKKMYTPTPEQIALACSMIDKKPTESLRWKVPIVSVSSVIDAWKDNANTA